MGASQILPAAAAGTERLQLQLWQLFGWRPCRCSQCQQRVVGGRADFAVIAVATARTISALATGGGVQGDLAHLRLDHVVELGSLGPHNQNKQKGFQSNISITQSNVSRTKSNIVRTRVKSYLSPEQKRLPEGGFLASRSRTVASARPSPATAIAWASPRRG